MAVGPGIALGTGPGGTNRPGENSRVDMHRRHAPCRTSGTCPHSCLPSPYGRGIFLLIYGGKVDPPCLSWPSKLRATRLPRPCCGLPRKKGDMSLRYVSPFRTPARIWGHVLPVRVPLLRRLRNPLRYRAKPIWGHVPPVRVPLPEACPVLRPEPTHLLTGGGFFCYYGEQ